MRWNYEGERKLSVERTYFSRTKIFKWEPLSETYSDGKTRTDSSIKH